MTPLQNSPFCPTSVSGSNFNPQNTKCIPVVKIFASLNSNKNFYFSKVSRHLQFNRIKTCEEEDNKQYAVLNVQIIDVYSESDIVRKGVEHFKRLNKE